MKTFHIHVHVGNLQTSIDFYSNMFAAMPSRVEKEYARWVLEDPSLNFAISTSGGNLGVDHLGFQTDDAAEFLELQKRAKAADMARNDASVGSVRGDKHWVTDPQGMAWEFFHTLDGIPMFSEREGRAAP